MDIKIKLTEIKILILIDGLNCVGRYPDGSISVFDSI